MRFSKRMVLGLARRSWRSSRRISGDSSTVGLGRAAGSRSSVGYNPVSFAAFQAQHSRKPRLFRVWAKLTSYYNFDYNDAEKTHPSIELRDKNRASLTGYIRSTAPTAPALLDVLKDSEPHAVIVELRYLPDSHEASVVEIERFLAERWRQQPEEVASGAGR